MLALTCVFFGVFFKLSVSREGEIDLKTFFFFFFLTTNRQQLSGC